MPSPSRLALAVAGLVACLGGNAGAAAPRGIKTLATEMSPLVSRCLIRRERTLVDRWLRTLPGSTEEDRLVRAAEPGFHACFDPYGQVSVLAGAPAYDRANMRAALVRALLQARRRDLPADPPPGIRMPWQEDAPGSPEAASDASAILAASLGLCLARKHWRNVVALIEAVDPKAESLDFAVTRRVEAARKRETAAVAAELTKVIPSIAGCVPAGTKLRMDRRRLRSLLEEAAYHLTSGDSPAAADAEARPTR